MSQLKEMLLREWDWEGFMRERGSVHQIRKRKIITGHQ
jgi:hypothetical protein